MWFSAVAGTAVGATSGLVAWLFLSWAFSRGTRTFAMVVLGGMAARLVLVLVLSMTLLKCTELQAIPYLVSLVAAFFAVQALELAYLRRRMEQKGPGSKTSV